MLAAPAESYRTYGDRGPFVLSDLLEEAENAGVGSFEAVDDTEWDHAGCAFDGPITKRTIREQGFFGIVCFW